MVDTLAKTGPTYTVRGARGWETVEGYSPKQLAQLVRIAEAAGCENASERLGQAQQLFRDAGYRLETEAMYTRSRRW